MRAVAAIDRQTGVLIALATLALAAAFVSWGAWVLLRRERKARQAMEPAEAPIEAAVASTEPAVPVGRAIDALYAAQIQPAKRRWWSRGRAAPQQAAPEPAASEQDAEPARTEPAGTTRRRPGSS